MNCSFFFVSFSQRWVELSLLKLSTVCLMKKNCLYVLLLYILQWTCHLPAKRRCREYNLFENGSVNNVLKGIQHGLLGKKELKFFFLSWLFFQQDLEINTCWKQPKYFDNGPNSCFEQRIRNKQKWLFCLSHGLWVTFNVTRFQITHPSGVIYCTRQPAFDCTCQLLNGLRVRSEWAMLTQVIEVIELTTEDQPVLHIWLKCVEKNV